MTANEARLFGTALDLILFILSFARMHQVRICEPQFILYLTLAMGWGWMLLGDIAFWATSIDLGMVEQVGPGIRLGVFRIILILGLAYVIRFGERRVQ